jgi:hypothetical protein
MQYSRSIDSVSPWPILVENGLFTDRPNIEACAAFIASTLNACNTGHSSCSVPQIANFTPTRLVYVGRDVPLDRPHLYETACQTRTNASLACHYIALSHCWGPKPILRTIQAVCKRFIETGIMWDELSRTFQETIALARALGIDYVWIDSLCKSLL